MSKKKLAAIIAVCVVVAVVLVLVTRLQPTAPVGSTHYHWGPGFPYGATEDVFAVAIVDEDGMEVWWYHDGWAGGWLPVGWYHDVYSINPASGLPRSVDPTRLSAPVSGLLAEHFPDADVVHYSRSPIDVADVPAPRQPSTLLEAP